MRKPIKPKQGSADPFLALLGEDAYYRLLADSPHQRPDDADLCHFAFNPLVDMDRLLYHWELRMLDITEFLEDAAHITANGIETIARGGRNTSWTHFEMFDGRFKSGSESTIGTILRNMYAERDMHNWAPFLRSIDAAVASRELPAAGNRRAAI